MSFCKLSAARDNRLLAKAPLRRAIDIGNDLIGNPKDEEGRFKEDAVQNGFDGLEDAFSEFREAHMEVREQLSLKVQKEKGGEDKDTVIEEVLVEDSDLYNIRPFLLEAITTVGELKSLLKTNKRKKAATEAKETKDFETKLKLDQARNELEENNKKKEAAAEAERVAAEARAEEQKRGEMEWQRRELEHLEKLQRLKEETEERKREAEEFRLREDERRRQEKHEAELRIVERNAEAQRHLWKQDPQFQWPAMTTAVIPAPGRPADANFDANPEQGIVQDFE